MIPELHRVIELIEGGWRGARVLVVGDLMIDRYVWGAVERISPEAPVPIVRSSQSTERPGGAANVAMNIAGLGGQATLIGFCGEDPDGDRLESALRESGIDPRIVRAAGHVTTSKLRILSGKQQMLRLDSERTDAYSDAAFTALIDKVEEAINSADAVVLSDYAKGVLSEEVCRRVIDAGRRKKIPVLVDPKHKDLSRYSRATTICPNISELSLATSVGSGDLDGLLQAGQNLVPTLGIDYLTATLSEKGIAILGPGVKFIAPAVARQVFDVSGAGDTVIATLALSLATGLEIEPAVGLANIAAGIVVGKVGTVPVTRDELLSGLMPEISLHAKEKVTNLDRLLTRVGAWRSSAQRVVFTNGCFDLLHIGHITLLEQARNQGDRLIVAINSDASVCALKGPTRPVVGERERARILAALAAVDAVVVFDDPTPLRLIEALRPDVIVKGGDYNEDTVVGAKEARAWGGVVRIVPTVEGFSTSKLIAKANLPAAPFSACAPEE